MLTERQKKLLKIIVEEHVKTAQPVGSKIIASGYGLDLSSATIRNEMATLEEMGLIEKTHTSSGRVPTEDGYRAYVDVIISSKPETKKNSFPMIDTIFNARNINREEAIKESMSLVSDLTNYASVALGDTAHKSTIKKLQYVSLGENLGILILVTNKGYVESKKIIVPEEISEAEINKVIDVLSEILLDSSIADIEKKLNDAFRKKEIRDRLMINEELVGALAQSFASMVKDQVFISGQSQLMNLPEFKDIDKAKSIYEVIDNENIVSVLDASNNSLSVKIGHDIEVKAMEDCTIISVPYKTLEGERGALAVIGPKRMEYKKVIPLLEYIASYVEKMK